MNNLQLNIPPIDVIAFLQANILQSLLTVLFAAVFMFSQKSIVNRIVFFVLAVLFGYPLVGIGIELFITQNWRYALGAVGVSIFTYVIAKGEIKK